MKAEVISIGDELLIGQTINTNASWLGQECSGLGIKIIHGTVIADDKNEIINALSNALNRVDLVLITGGLGPTKDDITKHTLADYFDTKLVMHQPTLEHIEAYFRKRNRPMLETNTRQAELPENCTILPNKNGTAAGMWFEKNGKIIISMPGVPYEMKAIMLDEVFPRLKASVNLSEIYHKTILTQGIGESFLAEIIKDWEDKVRDMGLSLAYLPSPGLVKLRLTANAGKERANEIDNLFLELEGRLPEHIFGYNNDSLSSILGKLLNDNQCNIATIESCTGGAIAQQITSIQGASAYFKGSVIAYSSEIKANIVGVPIPLIEQFGVVSQEVAESMALKGLEKLKSDYCIATTGIAGPNGGTEAQPVGTVWVAVASKKRLNSKQFLFGDNRERNINMTVLAAMNMARWFILSH